MAEKLIKVAALRELRQAPVLNPPDGVYDEFWADSLTRSTLTATPIPRTLQLALSGVREMSLISTPPRRSIASRCGPMSCRSTP